MKYNHFFVKATCDIYISDFNDSFKKDKVIMIGKIYKARKTAVDHAIFVTDETHGENSYNKSRFKIIDDIIKETEF